MAPDPAGLDCPPRVHIFLGGLGRLVRPDLLRRLPEPDRLLLRAGVPLLGRRDQRAADELARYRDVPGRTNASCPRMQQPRALPPTRSAMRRHHGRRKCFRETSPCWRRPGILAQTCARIREFSRKQASQGTGDPDDRPRSGAHLERVRFTWNRTRRCGCSSGMRGVRWCRGGRRDGARCPRPCASGRPASNA